MAFSLYRVVFYTMLRISNNQTLRHEILSIAPLLSSLSSTLFRWRERGGSGQDGR